MVEILVNISPNNRINLDCQIRCASLPAGYAERSTGPKLRHLSFWGTCRVEEDCHEPDSSDTGECRIVDTCDSGEGSAHLRRHLLGALHRCRHPCGRTVEGLQLHVSAGERVVGYRSADEAILDRHVDRVRPARVRVRHWRLAIGRSEASPARHRDPAGRVRHHRRPVGAARPDAPAGNRRFGHRRPAHRIRGRATPCDGAVHGVRVRRTREGLSHLLHCDDRGDARLRCRAEHADSGDSRWTADSLDGGCRARECLSAHPVGAGVCRCPADSPQRRRCDCPQQLLTGGWTRLPLASGPVVGFSAARGQDPTTILGRRATRPKQARSLSNKGIERTPQTATIPIASGRRSCPTR